ncbi:RtcB family protein [Candidatus Woesearchaeota archaeon]|nr:RtcB family protein [Candidatus Woesearchaeota archaeon]
MGEETCTKVRITNYSKRFYYPKNGKDLEELVIFPSAEPSDKGLVNSSVWVFNSDHSYDPAIIGPDVGCGIAAFKVPVLDYMEAADIIADYLKGKMILGRGNHFVDLCSSIVSQHIEDDDKHSVMLIHTDGKQVISSVPTDLKQARTKISDAEEFREELGYELSDVLGVNCVCFGNWTHNSVEAEDGKVVYRKGAIKTEQDKIHILPAHLGRDILVYTVQEGYLPPLNSMPHGTGRKGPLRKFKVSEEKARELRKQVYVPSVIPDSSLKSEHPNCYNSYSPILEKLNKFIVGLGHIDIKAYIGKL